MTGQRTTCLHCQYQDGIQTELIRYAHWGLCPIHSKDFLATVMEPFQMPEGSMMIPYSRLPGRDPLLRNVGVPGWVNRVMSPDDE